MGYFANGTEGDMYAEQWCSRCIHNQQEMLCPVIMAHMLWNYDECNNEASLLHKMIPREGIHNGACFAFSQAKASEHNEMPGKG